jgi:site-specific DNA-methyltransferase (adenine-specific)
LKPDYEEKGIQLYLGDCLEIMKTIPDKSIDLVLTDPPYGIDIASKGTVGVRVMAELKDYGSSNWDRQSPSQEYFNQMLRISKTAIIFGGNYFTDKLPKSKCWLCWDKVIPKGFTKAQIELV